MKPKIIDAFYYNGEVDILQLRLNILDPYVDEFVIFEANRTFSGIPKSSFFERDKPAVKPWMHKIRYVLLEDWDDKKLWDIAKGSANTNGADHWKQEFYNKEKMKEALVSLDDEDIVFISDCDEIWNPESLDVPLWNMFGTNIWRIHQKVYVYYLNMRSSEEWAGTLLLKYKTLKTKILNHLRGGIESHHPRIGNGWHFTNQGGIDEVKRKLNDSYTEQSYNTARAREMLPLRFGKDDWLDRNFDYTIDESEWPEFLRINREKYGRLLKS